MDRTAQPGSLSRKCVNDVDLGPMSPINRPSTLLLMDSKRYFNQWFTDTQFCGPTLNLQLSNVSCLLSYQITLSYVMNRPTIYSYYISLNRASSPGWSFTRSTSTIFVNCFLNFHEAFIIATSKYVHFTHNYRSWLDFINSPHTGHSCMVAARHDLRNHMEKQQCKMQGLIHLFKYYLGTSSLYIDWETWRLHPNLPATSRDFSDWM